MQRADAGLRRGAFPEPTVVNIGIISNDASADGKENIQQTSARSRSRLHAHWLHKLSVGGD